MLTVTTMGDGKACGCVIGSASHAALLDLSPRAWRSPGATLIGMTQTVIACLVVFQSPVSNFNAMWIFLNNAFLSIVADHAAPSGDSLLVRARSYGHIERVFPEAQVSATPDADYAFRAWVPRVEVSSALASQVAELRYPNFKDSIAEPEYHDACLEAWFALRGYQERHASHPGSLSAQAGE